MAKPDSTQASETLHEIESVFDRGARWVATNPALALGVVAGILALAAGVGGVQAWSRSREAKASAEVAEIQAGYFAAMGAKPGQSEIVEPANAEAAAAARQEFAQRLLDAADRLSGTRAAVVARIEGGDLKAELGERDAALAAWNTAADDAGTRSVLGALARTRVAAALEAAGDSAGAAAAYEAAAAVPGFAGRVLALGDAARCYAEASQDDRALAVFGSLSDDEVAALPVYVTARLRELRARTGAPEAADAAGAP